MRMRRLFSQTLREDPSEAVTVSHQLLMRAGFIRPLDSGIFAYLPLGRRTLRKLETLACEELSAIGGQEVMVPAVQPVDLWERTAAWKQGIVEATRFHDRAGHAVALGLGSEAPVTFLAKGTVASYRQLPQVLYHVQRRWRDNSGPHGGFLRLREGTVVESCSLDVTREALQAQYRAHYQAFFNIYHCCGLSVVSALAADHAPGETLGHRFVMLAPAGDEQIVCCEGCGYTADHRVARFEKPGLQPESARPLERVETPGVKTIDALAEFLDIPAARTAKAVFLVAALPEDKGSREQVVFAVVRGDMEVSEAKLRALLGARGLRPATDEEIRAIGSEPGYGSPLGVHDALIVVDDAIPVSPNLVAGANEVGMHVRNVNYGRDFVADLVGDIAAAQAGDVCPCCGAPLRLASGIAVGSAFELGTHYSDVLEATFVDSEGGRRPFQMGQYTLELDKVLAGIAETHHDEHGLIWPICMAPYQVHLVALGRGEEVLQVAERLYHDLQSVGIEVLFDDREESAGVKFMDADLIGLPLRLTVGGRGLKKGGVELKHRAAETSIFVSLEEVVPGVQSEIAKLRAERSRAVVKVPFVG